MVLPLPATLLDSTPFLQGLEAKKWEGPGKGEEEEKTGEESFSPLSSSLVDLLLLVKCAARTGSKDVRQAHRRTSRSALLAGQRPFALSPLHGDRERK